MPGTLVIVNPNASHVRNRATRQTLAKQLEAVLSDRDGVAPRIVETASQEDTRPLVEAALTEDVAAVIGVGGDGTMRDIAAVLAGLRVPLGIIPAGTGNQVAAVLGIPLSLEAAVTTLQTDAVRTVDLGEVTLRPSEGPATTSNFILGCGSGFDARLMATTPGDLKQKIGKSAYVAQAVKLAMAIDVIPYRLTVDGETLETEASIALVGNMGQVIPGMLDLRLPIQPDDGLLDLIVVGARGPLHGMKGLVDQLSRTALGGEHGSDSVRLRGRHIIIEPDRPEPLEVDGDYVTDGSLEATVIPAALRVLVPPKD
ncbi:MAG: diacylglycerol kinase family protein [Chloroflexota bacterium]|nr:diacylglycerol kinase family protein [Chloroflexota bacterium]